MSRIPTLTRTVDQPPLNRSPKRSKSGSRAVPLENTQPIPRGSLIAEVPLSTLSYHSAWTATGHWRGTFDCALWLRTPQGLPNPANLAVCYVDNQGEKAVFVDRCAPGSYRTVLLNGSIDLSVSGRVTQIGLYLIGATDTCEVHVEEWHLVPQQRRQR